VVFAIENNGVAEMTRQADHQCIEDVSERASGYKMPAAVVDGNDVMAVYDAACKAIQRARDGKGPSIVECKTYRIAGHYIGDPEEYRDPAEVAEWKKPEKDPILRFENLLLEKKILKEKDTEDIRMKIKAEIDQALAFAEDSPHPDLSELMADVYV
jgi:pyruvate dehydrogenase E1 component alpha subunit